MPVNIRQAPPRMRRSSPEPLDGDDAAPPHVVDGAAPGAGEQRPGVVAAEQRGREVQDVAVDEAGAVEVAGDRGAAFDHHLHDAPAARARRARSPSRPSSSSAGWTLRASAGAAEHDPQRVARPRRGGRSAPGRRRAPCRHRRSPRRSRPAGGGRRPAPRLAGDPLAGAVGRRGAPVERGRELEHDVRPAGRAVLEVRRELASAPRPRSRRLRPRCRRRAAARMPRPVHARVRVLDADDHPGDPRGDDRVGARWRAGRVGARLERADDASNPRAASPAASQAPRPRHGGRQAARWRLRTRRPSAVTTTAADPRVR